MPGAQARGALMSKWLPLGFGLLIVCLAGVEMGWASSFKVVPIRVYVSARDKSAVLEVTNEGPRNLTVQLDVKAWSQDESGTDRYEPTQDIVFFPKIATLQPKQSQIIRLGIRGKPNPEMERTYRFFIAELPVERPGGSTVLRFALNISLPVFITPLQPTKNWEITGGNVAGQAVVATVSNRGNQHVYVTEVQAKAADAAGTELFSGKSQGWYVLAGRNHFFELPLPAQACPAVRHLAVSATVGADSARNEFNVEPDAAQCQAPQERTGEQGGSKR
jgi:fimbrial chaperone protein